MSDPELIDVQESKVRLTRSTILSKDDLISRAHEVAADPEVFNEFPLFFFGVDASNTSIDSYGTSMALSSLKNYAEDATAGIPLQNSHKTRELPFGRSLAGKFVGGSNARMSADFYTIEGLEINEVDTSQLIAGIRSGLVKDVSIGFFGGWCRCSICNKDMYDWSAGWSEMCQHWPGEEYDIVAKDGSVTGREMCVGFIEDAHLSEISTVYKGACPDAVIKKTVRAIEARVIQPKIVEKLESRYQVRFVGSSKRYAGVLLPEGAELMRTENESRQVELIVVDGEPAVVEAVVAATADNNETLEAPVEGTVGVADATIQTDPPVVEEERSVSLLSIVPDPVRVDTEEVAVRSALTKAGVNPGKDPNETLRVLVSEYKRLIPLAKDGEAYRADLIDDTLDTGVRALGNKFNREAYKTLLSEASIESIKEIRAGFADTATEITPIGRITKDNTDNIVNSIDKITPIRVPAKPNTVFANG